MAKQITLNVLKGKEYILATIDEEDYQTLLALSLLSFEEKHTEKKNIQYILDKYNIEKYTSIIAIAGDSSKGVIFDNIRYSKLLPSTTIDRKASYYCYSNLDYTIKHANSILHEDSSSCLKCATLQLGDPKFVILYEQNATTPDWTIHTEKLIKLTNNEKLNRKKVIPT